MHVRITHLDGKLPNLALMNLSYAHKKRGDTVYFTKSVKRELFEETYDRVYGSSIFSFNTKKQDAFLKNFPNAIIGGTGSKTTITVEDVIPVEKECFDYSLYPEFQNSIGFSQRGCRLKCKFCVVPQKEGKNKDNKTIAEIWRGNPFPKNILLLDNDFFGQPLWEQKANEIIDGQYKVCFSQGINIRLIDDRAAEYLPKIRYYDSKFKTKKLYTAWDNLGDKKIFFKGVERLEKFGTPPHHLMVYMLIGFKPNETMEDICSRFNDIVALGCKPYPMVYNNSDLMLKKFQRWAIMRYYEFMDWDEYLLSKRPSEKELVFDPKLQLSFL
jgi:hypothetical protein